MNLELLFVDAASDFIVRLDTKCLHVHVLNGLQLFLRDGELLEAFVVLREGMNRVARHFEEIALIVTVKLGVVGHVLSVTSLQDCLHSLFGQFNFHEFSDTLDGSLHVLDDVLVEEDEHIFRLGDGSGLEALVPRAEAFVRCTGLFSDFRRQDELLGEETYRLLQDFLGRVVGVELGVLDEVKEVKEACCELVWCACDHQVLRCILLERCHREMRLVQTRRRLAWWHVLLLYPWYGQRNVVVLHPRLVVRRRATRRHSDLVAHLLHQHRPRLRIRVEDDIGRFGLVVRVERGVQLDLNECVEDGLRVLGGEFGGRHDYGVVDGEE